MKLSRSSYDHRRRNPLALVPIIAVLALVLLLGWLWSRGGPQPQTRVEKPIPAERLGH